MMRGDFRVWVGANVFFIRKFFPFCPHFDLRFGRIGWADDRVGVRRYANGGKGRIGVRNRKMNIRVKDFIDTNKGRTMHFS